MLPHMLSVFAWLAYLQERVADAIRLDGAAQAQVARMGLSNTPVFARFRDSGKTLGAGGAYAVQAFNHGLILKAPGTLGDERSSAEDSFSDGLLDWPHYTRPVEWQGLKVPEVLQSGDHAAIRRWRLKQALGRTWLRRPDLLARLELTGEQSQLLNEFLADRLLVEES